MSALSLLDKARMVFGNEDQRNLYVVPKFMNAHKDMLVIIADPKTDRIFVGHKGHFVNGRIKSLSGRKAHVVRDVLKYGRFDATIDQFIGSLAESLNIPLKAGNQFYSFLDGALFNIAKALRKKGKADPPSPASGAVPSPLRRGETGTLEGEL